MNLIVSNDGLRLIQMHQLKKRDFVATDHVSYSNCLKSSVVVVVIYCINLYVFVEQDDYLCFVRITLAIASDKN